jgi:hypothetical protein
VISGKATNTNFKIFGLTRSGSNPQSTALEASTLTITPAMQLCICCIYYKEVWSLSNMQIYRFGNIILNIHKRLQMKVKTWSTVRGGLGSWCLMPQIWNFNQSENMMFLREKIKCKKYILKTNNDRHKVIIITLLDRNCLPFASIWVHIFCVVLLCVFTPWVPWCGVCCGFHIGTMFVFTSCCF